MFLVAAVCAALLAWPVGPFQPLSGSPPAPEAERSSRRVSGAPAGAPAAPVLSLRRVPAFLAGLAAGHRLQDEIDRVLADARLDTTGGRACARCAAACSGTITGTTPCATCRRGSLPTSSRGSRDRSAR